MFLSSFQASWDEPAQLQNLALHLSDKVNNLIDNNEIDIKKVNFFVFIFSGILGWARCHDSDASMWAYTTAEFGTPSLWQSQQFDR